MSRKSSIPAPPKNVHYMPESSAPSAPDARPILRTGSDVYHALADIRAMRQEHFVVFDLDRELHQIRRRVVHIGSLNDVEVHPREVFRGAIESGASQLVLAHNHPSGNAEPGHADVASALKLRSIGELLEIPVLDSLIVADGSFVSLAERLSWKPALIEEDSVCAAQAARNLWHSIPQIPTSRKSG